MCIRGMKVEANKIGKRGRKCDGRQETRGKEWSC